MKKLILTTMLVFSLFSLSACSNKSVDKVIDTNPDFSKAEIKMFDGTVKRIKVKSYSFDGYSNNIKVKATDGTTYYSSGDNIMLISK